MHRIQTRWIKLSIKIFDRFDNDKTLTTLGENLCSLDVYSVPVIYGHALEVNNNHNQLEEILIINEIQFNNFFIHVMIYLISNWNTPNWSFTTNWSIRLIRYIMRR